MSGLIQSLGISYQPQRSLLHHLPLVGFSQLLSLGGVPIEPFVIERGSGRWRIMKLLWFV